MCDSPDEWPVRLQQLGLPSNAIGFARPVTATTEFAPDVCQALEAFWSAPDKAAVTTHCQTGTRDDYYLKTERVRITKRVKVHGKWVKRKVWVTEQVVEYGPVPVYGACPQLWGTLVALSVPAHEAIHIGGVIDEGITECYAVQHFAEVAEHFGATPALAHELAVIYWTWVYPRKESAYYRFDCVDGSALDLNPASDIWP